MSRTSNLHFWCMVVSNYEDNGCRQIIIDRWLSRRCSNVCLMCSCSSLAGGCRYMIAYVPEENVHKNKLIAREKWGDLWKKWIVTPCRQSEITYVGQFLAKCCLFGSMSLGESLYIRPCRTRTCWSIHIWCYSPMYYHIEIVCCAFEHGNYVTPCYIQLCK